MTGAEEETNALSAEMEENNCGVTLTQADSMD